MLFSPLAHIKLLFITCTWVTLVIPYLKFDHRSSRKKNQNNRAQTTANTACFNICTFNKYKVLFFKDNYFKKLKIKSNHILKQWFLYSEVEMNAIPLTPLDALIWKTCRVKLNERELRALVLLLISLLNVALALMNICFEVFQAQLD